MSITRTAFLAAVQRNAARVAAYQAQEESQPEPAQTEADRISAVENKTAQHDVEIEQIVTGLEALSNGG